MNKKCVQCGRVFTLTDSEIHFFESRNLNIPKRCKECREKNKAIEDILSPYTIKAKPTKSKSVNRGTQKAFIIKKTHLILAVFFLISVISICKNSFDTNGFNLNQKYNVEKDYSFRNENLLQEHFDKHGSELGYESASQYVDGANAVIKSPDALQKNEVEDGDYIYYKMDTNELVILSVDGYIRSYFKPEDGLEYYKRQ